jgi:hypothetical protein
MACSRERDGLSLHHLDEDLMVRRKVDGCLADIPGSPNLTMTILCEVIYRRPLG